MGHVLIVGRLFTSIFLLALILSSCQSPAAAVPFEIVWHDHFSRLDHPRNFTIRDEGTWRISWQAMVARYASAPQWPDVDFRKFMLVSVYLGPRPYVGFEVSIESVQLEGEKVVVSYRESQPQSGAELAHAATITSPLCVAKIPYSDKAVEFVALPVQVQ